MKRRTAPLTGALLILAAGAAGAATAIDGARSRFTEQVQGSTRPALPAGDEATASWALGGARQMLYRIDQTEIQVTTQRLDGATRTIERESETGGTMVVFARGGGEPALVRVSDATTRTTVRAGGESESASAPLPTVESKGLTASGRLLPSAETPAPTSLDNLVTALFALPGSALEPGAAAEVPVRFGAAVQWGQSLESMQAYPVVVEGVATVTLAGRERAERCECLRYDIAFDLASATPPRDFPGRFRIVVRGDARTWFDPRMRRMAEGELAMVLGIDLGAPERPDDAGMSILTDTHTRVRLGR